MNRRIRMANSNMIGAYFWACRIFQPELPPSLGDVDEIFLIPINADLESGGNGQHAYSSTDTKRTILKDISEK